MTVSRSSILFGLIIFYSFMIVIYSAYGLSVIDFKDNDITSKNDIDFDTSEYDIDTNTRGVVKYLKGIIIGFNETPVWLNLLFFIPLSIFFIYLVLVAWINPGG